LFKAKSTDIQLYHDGNNIFAEMMMVFVVLG